MGSVKRFATVSVLVGAVTACAAQSNAPIDAVVDRSGATPPGLTCPVMTRVEYDHVRYRTMLGPSPGNPLICLVERKGRAPESLILNWYTFDRLRAVDVEHGIEVITSLLTGPVGFTTSWNRFLGGGNFPYVSRFTVEPDQSIAIAGKTYDVRVIRGINRPYEKGETWIDKKSLLILKYVDSVYPAKSYTVTDVVKVPAS